FLRDENNSTPPNDGTIMYDFWVSNGRGAPVVMVQQVLGTNDIALPVELSSFSAKGMDNAVYLEWKTVYEMDNAGFEILRSREREGDYQVIASYSQWDELKGQGNSSMEITYQFTDRTVINEEKYFYKLTDVSLIGVRTEHGPIMVIAGENSTFSDDPNIPLTYYLANPYPNPFNPEVNVEFGIPVQELEQEEQIKVIVFDQMGRKVYTLYNGSVTPGRYKVTWNGINSHGNKVSSGVYFIMINTPSFKSAKKVLMIK
ncbi:MAG: gliding motility-associated C-terminal domain-containing protein, partial [Calditrichia bacterium]|nr:gliding motility-associated C-terminal domain-containing protein [Calditrichia bacterium]